MEDFKMSGYSKLDLMCDVHSYNELLPLYCLDCDCPLCGDCVTCNHVGHKLRKVSEVVDNQVRQLKEYLGKDRSRIYLKRLFTEFENKQKEITEHRDNLLRNVVDREKEIIEQVKLWREKMTEKIINFADDKRKSIDKDMVLTSALLQCKDSVKDLGIEREDIYIIVLSHGLRKLLNAENKCRSIVQCLEYLEFRKGIVNENLFDLFGELIDETEISSDEYQRNDDDDDDKDDDNDDNEFHESYDFKMSIKYKLCSYPINDIVPLQDHNTLLLSNDTVYSCDIRKGDLNRRPVVSNVIQIALIPSCWDVLLLAKSLDHIKRISNGSLVTTYAKTNYQQKKFCGVGSAGTQGYACVAHKTFRENSWLSDISLLDEFGRILMTLPFHSRLYSPCRLTFYSDEKEKCVVLLSNSVELLNIEVDTIKRKTIYSGSVGPHHASAFSPKDISVDNHGNIMVAVRNDNAIHLLDKTLTFQKLLMTEEDGLDRPTSVALDAEGYLYVGCEDGQIHVINYQYLFSTNRISRLRYEKLKPIDSSLNFPGKFCPKMFREILKNH